MAMAAPSKKRSREDTMPDVSKRARTAKQQPSGTAAAAPSAPKTDTNGDPYWDISRARRVTVSTFKGRTMVNVREYYEKDGQELPGKKGISMPLDQFNALIELLPGIESAVQRKGGSLVRPEYVAGGAVSMEEEEEESDEQSEDEGDEEQEENGDEDENEGVVRRSGSSESKLKRTGSGRQNIEATSDEDESE